MTPSKQPLRKIFKIHARHLTLTLGKYTRIMGILNITPDSFSGDGTLIGRRPSVSKNVRIAQRLIREGADIIDIGGESSRPGARAISPQEEIHRIIPTVRALAKAVKISISVDTYKEAVAKNALDNGAHIINNIMGVKVSKDFLRMVRNYDAAIVLMHIRGKPRTMQKNITYANLIEEILQTLRKSIEKCLEIGIKSDKIIIDPGIGFGKTAQHNLEILKQLESFKTLNQPILVGTSRKSFIGKTLNRAASERLMGTAATVCAAILKGAHVIRIHDVAQLRDVVTMSDAILNDRLPR